MKAQFNRALALVSVALLAAPAAFAQTSPVDDIFAAIDLSGVVVKVVAAAVIVIGIAMAFKGTDLGKRTVRKV